MNVKHTPGPWHWHDIDGFRHRLEPIGRDQDELPILVATHVKERDARLIAAAPELFDALADLESQCRKWAPNIDRSRAVAAIAKATQSTEGVTR